MDNVNWLSADENSLLEELDGLLKGIRYTADKINKKGCSCQLQICNNQSKATITTLMLNSSIGLQLVVSKNRSVRIGDV